MILTFPYTINSDFDPNITWSRGTNEYTLNSTDVHVWNIEVPDHFHDLFKEYRSILNQEEFFKAKAFHWEEDFRSYLTGRIALRILLSKYLSKPLKDIRFNPESKKPSIISRIPIKYNLSYSDKYILISFGLCETGIDVEDVKQSFDFTELLPTCFSKAEIKSIGEDQEKSKREFFLQWTRKEALLKYTGQGIIDDLTTIPSLSGTHQINNEKLSLETDINLLSFHLNSNCIGSLVYPSYISNIKYFEWK